MRFAAVLLALVACEREHAPPPATSPITVTAVDAAPVEVPPPDEATATCARRFPSDGVMRATTGPPTTTIAEILRTKPREGVHTLSGWVQRIHHCPPCPPDADCKPCEEQIWVSDSFGAFKHPMSTSTDLLVDVPDATKFEALSRYQLTIVACPGTTRPVLELRGYRKST